MARVNNLTNFLTDVANAIKEKTGDNSSIPASQFDSKILAIPAQGSYQTKSISIVSNGTMTLLPDTNYDAMDRVVISVDVPTGQINNQDKEITENGVYTADEGYTGLGTILVKVKDGEEVDTNARNTLMYILGINQIAFNALKNTLKIEQDYIDAGGTPDEICYVLNKIIEGGN